MVYTAIRQGEYTDGHGCPMPSQIRFRSERFGLWFESARRKRMLREETRRGALGDCRSRIRYSPESTCLQAGSAGSVPDGVRTRDRDSKDNLYVRYLYWNDGAWNRNYNWLDNRWNDQNSAAVSASVFTKPPNRFGGFASEARCCAIRQASFQLLESVRTTPHTCGCPATSSPKEP